MIPQAVQIHIGELRERHPDARLFALVDGIQYERQTGKRFDRTSAGVIALFDGTEDEPLAHAGPWLVEMLTDEHAAITAQLEAARPSVVWVVSTDDAPTLADKLRQRLNATQPDGTELLMRFWDPRALHALIKSMSEATRTRYFGAALAWLYLFDGERFYLTLNA
ncbi:DUF4123 domain-containing protein [Caballeronia sp. AZ10_KS36]|uniref:DUF4123 domain-containing protein n=1 Tax=Caballeronia sp. AZ10_KS36 TaxID=2921757 RepID=UPI0020297E6E|nr:DUF4123 domain-containing protein [Caballeronia sp. AZ10_KS36]